MTHEQVEDIDTINFGILSAEDIRGMSVCSLDSTKLVGPNTVYDKRMGCVTDTNEKCVTCDKKKDCWGHFGHIELTEPILHPLFTNVISGTPSIVDFLKCFCKNKDCNRLLITEDQIRLGGLVRYAREARFKRILEKLDGIGMCSYCSRPQPQISFVKGVITMEYRTKMKGQKEEKIGIVMGVAEILKMFDNISDEDVILAGFDPKNVHPRNMIITVLPVLPPCSRPYVITDGNETCDDDLTTQILEIIKLNLQLQKPDITEQKRQKAIQSLIFRVKTMFINTQGKAKHPTDNRAIKCIKTRISGKKGQLRTNNMGKRVDFSGRTVIGADPSLKIDELGTPHAMCAILTKPEPVTEYNIKWLTKLVNNDQANFVVHNNTRISLKYAMYRRGTELLYDDVIVRDSSIKIKTMDDGTVILPKELHSEEYIRIGSTPVILRQGDRLIRNGLLIPVRYPVKKRFTLQLGDVVERHIRGASTCNCTGKHDASTCDGNRDADVVMFNRQPSLHKNSALAMKVVPMPYKTLRMNLAATKSFNADKQRCLQQGA